MEKSMDLGFINHQTSIEQVWKYLVDWAASCSEPAISALKQVPGKESRLQELGGGEELHRCDSGARGQQYN